jgi:hypothetical protein
MFTTIGQAEVFNAVIRLVAIDMMDVLAFFQSAPKVSLHHKPMLGPIAAIDAEIEVPSVPDALTSGAVQTAGASRRAYRFLMAVAATSWFAFSAWHNIKLCNSEAKSCQDYTDIAVGA